MLGVFIAVVAVRVLAVPAPVMLKSAVCGVVVFWI